MSEMVRLSEARISPFIPLSRGMPGVDGRPVISGIKGTLTILADK